MAAIKNAIVAIIPKIAKFRAFRKSSQMYFAMYPKIPANAAIMKLIARKAETQVSKLAPIT
ncbi:MAG: hypothetical protein QXT63_02345 [Thermoplasmata archaeon]